MLGAILLKTGISNKITRPRIEIFLRRQGDLMGLTLDLGCGSSIYKEYMQNRVGFDVNPGPGVDVVGGMPIIDMKKDQDIDSSVESITSFINSKLK